MQYYDFLSNQYKEKINPNLFAVHFIKLSCYNKKWDLSKILIYELMLVMSRKTGHKDYGFYKQQHIICKETRLGKHKVRTAIKSLEDDGIINVKRSQGGRFMYTVNFDWIVNNLDKVYDFSEVPADEVEILSEIMETFISYHANHEYYENRPRPVEVIEDGEPFIQTPIAEVKDDSDVGDSDDDSTDG